MPKRGESFSFFPRRKEGEDPDGPLTRHLSVTYGDLEALFHLPLKDAARELGLCPTTFKKACRSFNMEQWPFRKGQNRTPLARGDSQTDVVDAAMTLHQDPAAPAPPTLQTTEAHQAMRAVMVSCTEPSAFGFSFPSNSASRSAVGSSSFAGRPAGAGPDSFGFSFPSNSASRSTAGSDPFGAIFSRAAPQQAAMALDARSCGEEGHAGPAFQQTFALQDPPKSIDSSTRDRVFVGVPLPQRMPTRACEEAQGGATAAPRSTHGGHADPAPPRQRPCIDAGILSTHGAHGGASGAVRLGGIGGPGGGSFREHPSVEAVMEYLAPGRASGGRVSGAQERPCVEAVMEYLAQERSISEADMAFMLSD